MWTVRYERCWSEDGHGYVHKQEMQGMTLPDVLGLTMKGLTRALCIDTEPGENDGQVMHAVLLEVVYEHR